MRTNDEIIKKYILYMINYKEIKGCMLVNRTAPTFYFWLRQNAKKNHTTIMQELKRDAYYVISDIWLEDSQL